MAFEERASPWSRIQIRWQLDVHRFVLWHLGVKIRPGDVHEIDHLPVLVIRLMDLFPLAWELRGRMAEHHPQRLKRWCRREYRIFSSHAYFPCDQSAPYPGILVVPFIGLHPSHADGRTTRALPRLIDSPDGPDFLLCEVTELDRTCCSTQIFRQWKSCQIVHEPFVSTYTENPIGFRQCGLPYCILEYSSRGRAIVSKGRPTRLGSIASKVGDVANPLLSLDGVRTWLVELVVGEEVPHIVIPVSHDAAEADDSLLMHA